MQPAKAIARHEHRSRGGSATTAHEAWRQSAAAQSALATSSPKAALKQSADLFGPTLQQSGPQSFDLAGQGEDD